VVLQRGKRKDMYLDLEQDAILLDGWDLPLKADTECGGVFAGNACFNLIGDPEAIRSLIETRAVLPVRAEAKGKILVSPQPQTGLSDEAKLLHPEIETHHAVVNRLKLREAL